MMNGTGYVYYEGRPTADLSDWLAELGFQEGAAWVYVERLDAIELLPWGTDFNPAAWEHGRVFDCRLEARWTLRDGGQAVTWLLTESPDLAADGAKQYDVDTPYGVYLWGRHLSKLERPELVERPQKGQEAWAEARMPRLLMYPVEGTPEFVVAQAVDYYRAGRPAWTRWTGIGSAGTPGEEGSNG